MTLLPFNKFTINDILMCLCLAVSTGVEISESRIDRDSLDEIIKKAESVIDKRQDKFDTH